MKKNSVETYKIKWYETVKDYIMLNVLYTEIKSFTFSELEKYINVQHEKTGYIPLVNYMQE